MEIQVFITTVFLTAPANADLVCEGLKTFLRDRKSNTIPAPMSRVIRSDVLLSCVKNCTVTESCRSYKFYDASKQCILLDENDKPLQKEYHDEGPVSTTARTQNTIKPDSPLNKCSEMGYTFLSSSKTCVRLYKKSLKWSKAANFCGLLNGSLVTIKTEQKQVLMSNLARKVSAGRVWIGALDMHNTDTFEWWDGSAMNYTAWGHNEPSHRAHFPFGSGEENCVQLMSWSRYKWNDSNCDKKCKFICEMKAVN